MSRLPPELESEMTPGVKAFVLSLLERIDQLTEQVEKLTPRNPSIPPSTEHPMPGQSEQRDRERNVSRAARKGTNDISVSWSPWRIART